MTAPSPNTPFFYNEVLLSPDLRAPVPLILNERVGFRAALRDLLIRHHVPPVLVEPATVIGGSLLFGCQEFIAGCHALLASTAPPEMKKASQRLLSACREFSGNMDGIYVFQQTVDGLAAAPLRPEDQEAACSRLKFYSSCIEDFFAAPPFTVRMDLDRMGLLQVQLDSVYDETCRQLERFYLAAIRKTSTPLFVRFALGLYRDVTKRIVPVNIFEPLKDAAAASERRPGLLDLLPDLEESLGDR